MNSEITTQLARDVKMTDKLFVKFSIMILIIGLILAVCLIKNFTSDEQPNANTSVEYDTDSMFYVMDNCTFTAKYEKFTTDVRCVE